MPYVPFQRRGLGAGLLLVGMLAANTAFAASIEVSRSQDGPAVVVIQGPLVLDDIEDFRTKIMTLPNAVVALQSDGGSLVAGIRIGTLIRMRNFPTLVPNGSRCASACAIAWLGGTRRFLGERSQVGFHAAYRDDEGRPTETGVGNALLGSYLGQLGLSDTAVVYVTKAAPTTMTWLTAKDASNYGIDVSLLSANETTATTSSPVGQQADQRIGEFVADWLKALSLPDTQALESLTRMYANSVLYYGKPTSREMVLADKRRFFERWPERVYKLRPETLTTSCDAGACSLSGILDWNASSPVRMVQASGVAKFEYVVAIAGTLPRITSETSSVVERQNTGSTKGLKWWVILASFKMGAEGLEASTKVISSAERCGARAVGDLSSNFVGFAPGSQVVVVGAFSDRSAAERARVAVAPCVPGVFIKQGSYVQGAVSGSTLAR